MEQDERLMKPVFTEKDITYIWIKVNNIFVVSVAKGNPNVAMVLTFLYKVRDVFCSYFKELEDESLRDNFVITYELLDEMMDHGYPQITSPEVLKSFITQRADRAADDPTVDDAVRSHPTVQSYVERVLDAAVDANVAATSFDGMFDEKFEMRYPVRTAAAATALIDNGFWGDFGSGLDDEAFDAMVALLSGAVAGEEVRAFGDSDASSIDEKKRAKLEDLARQLRDVEPKFDFEVSVIARPIVTTLFWGAAARQWHSHQS